MKKKNIKNIEFEEEYKVIISYKTEEGILIQSHPISIFIKTKKSKEKSNHKKAEKEILKKYPNCKIHSVSYV